MAKYKPTNFDQITLIPVDFKSQLSPGTFEYTLDYLIENEMDLSIFDHRYQNDDTGRRVSFYATGNTWEPPPIIPKSFSR